MNRARLLGALVACVVLLAGCGSGKKSDKASSVQLPQQVSYFDNAVTFRLPEGWVSKETSENPDLDFVIANSQALYDTTQDKKYISNFATGAFMYAYDPTVVLKDSKLGVKENVVVGAGIAMPATGQDANLNPTAMLQFFYDQAAKSVPALGSDTEIAANRAWFNLDKSTIKTFKNGASARFKTVGGLQGVIGAVRAGQNFVLLFLVTDKPDSYLGTFEAILQSITLTEGTLPVATVAPPPTTFPTPTAAEPLIVVVTGAPPVSTMQSQNGQMIIVITATPSSTPLPTSAQTTAPTLRVVTIPAETAAPAYVTATPIVIKTLPPTGVVPAATATPACVYTVKAGDTLYFIAVSLNVTLDDLFAANPSIGDGTHLQIGDQLTIPGCTP